MKIDILAGRLADVLLKYPLISEATVRAAQDAARTDALMFVTMHKATIRPREKSLDRKALANIFLAFFKHHLANPAALSFRRENFVTPGGVN